ncbi:MAG: serine hydrolase domain-containing protein [Myxococcota bacterium]
MSRAPSSPGAFEVDGTCDPRFAAVGDAFRANFAERGELGAALCVRLGGRSVVDLWGGFRDRGATRRWRRDTLVNAYSVGKGLLAMLALQLVDRGRLGLDRPVAEPWPEFAAEDKGTVSLRELLSHRAGLPAVRERLPEDAMYDWSRMCAALAGQAPYWRPGTRHGYHCNTLGFLVGELIRRATGTRVGDALREHVTGPAEAEFHFGLPADRHARVAEVDAPQVVFSGPEQWAQAFPPTGDARHDEMIWHTYFNPSGLSGMGTVNTRAWREAVIPSTNGHGTARGVARAYESFVCGGPGRRPSVSPALHADATTVQVDGDDLVLGRPSRFGLGFQLPRPERPLGPNAGAYGHYGYGGSLGFADPDLGLGFGFLTNRPGDRWQTPRTQALVDALYGALA